MLKTERMRKVVVAGARPHLRTVIEHLHRLAALHIEEHRPDHFFGIGAPLPEGEAIAEALLRARGLERSLGLEHGAAPAAPLASLDEAVARVDAVETGIADLVAERSAKSDDIKRLEEEIVRLRRVAPLGLRLEEMTGYKALKVYTGTVDTDPSAALARISDRFHLVTGHGANGLAIALFVPKANAGEVESELAAVGFRPVEVPAGTGTVEAAIGARTTEARQAAARIEAVEAELARYRAEHGPALLSAVETLSAAAEKAGAPLGFAAAANSFVITGYVPAAQATEVERALQAATGQRLFIEFREPVLADHHGHHTGERHDTHTGAEAHAADEPPIKFGHRAAGVRSFTMMLGMHSLPKYKELDPTVLMWIAFPIFFGLMVGDAAFGILIGLVAWFFRGHYLFGIGGPRVSRMLMLSAVWTFLFGMFFFGEAFGIHFVDEPGVVSWEHLLHADWSHYYASAQHGITAMAAENGAHAAEAATEEHHAPHLKLLGVQLGFYSKLHDVTTLLIISLIIAAVHLNIAILMGIRNMWVLHGPKHAILGRFSWLVLQTGLGLVGYGTFAHDPMLVNIGWGTLGVSVLMLLAGEGAIAILELPKILSNALSYTRLVAVGLSKAGMLLAVNVFAFTMTSDHTATITGWGTVAMVGSLLLILVGYLTVLGLGILAGGLHSMRLQFVEFFGWFYEGGGRPFRAFGDSARRR